eukprot:jgi/Mesen1/8133/ME000437S07230
MALLQGACTPVYSSWLSNRESLRQAGSHSSSCAPGRDSLKGYLETLSGLCLRHNLTAPRAAGTNWSEKNGSRGLSVQARASSAYASGATKQSHVLAGPAEVEKGRYSFEVENVINSLIALAPRGSIARMMDSYKNRLTMQPLASPSIGVRTRREGMLDKALELFEEMPENDVEWNVYSFTALINAYGRNGSVRPRAAATCPRHLSPPPVPALGAACQLAATGAASERGPQTKNQPISAHKYEAALELLERMKAEGVAPNLVTYNTVMTACAKGGLPWDGLIHLFAQMRREAIQPNIMTYNTLMSACMNRRLTEEAGMVFRTLVEAGVAPDQATYWCLVEAYALAQRLPDAQALLAEMEADGNVPEVVAYNTLIDAFGRRGMYLQAGQVFKQMRTAGCAPNVETYSTLLQAYGMAGRYDEVRVIVADMKERGLEPSLVTFNTLISVFGRGGFFREAVSLFHDMTAGGGAVEPDAVSYQALLYACGKGGRHQEATLIYRCRAVTAPPAPFPPPPAPAAHMQQSEVTPSAEMLANLMYAYGGGAMYTDAFITLQSAAAAGCEPNQEMYDAMVEIYSRGGLHYEASQMFNAMVERDLEGTDLNTFNLLIAAYGKAGQLHTALSVFNNLREMNPEADYETHAALLEVYSSAGLYEEARAEFLEMEEAGMEPECSEYCLLLSVGARRGRWEEVRKLLQEMGKYEQQSLTHRTVHTLIMGEMDEDATWQMVEGVWSNMAFYNALLEALWLCGLHKRAAGVLQRVRERGIFPEAVRHTGSLWAIDVHRSSSTSSSPSLLKACNAVAIMPLSATTCLVVHHGIKPQSVPTGASSSTSSSPHDASMPRSAITRSIPSTTCSHRAIMSQSATTCSFSST